MTWVTKLQSYVKGVSAFAGLIALVIGTELGTDSKWYAYAVAFFAACGVVLLPNKPTSA